MASACSGGHFELAKLLINAGGDVNLSDEVFMYCFRGFLIAVFCLLFKIGCDPLLPVACSLGQSNLVELLLEKGCNPNSRNQVFLISKCWSKFIKYILPFSVGEERVTLRLHSQSLFYWHTAHEFLNKPRFLCKKRES